MKTGFIGFDEFASSVFTVYTGKNNSGLIPKNEAILVLYFNYEVYLLLEVRKMAVK